MMKGSSKDDESSEKEESSDKDEDSDSKDSKVRIQMKAARRLSQSRSRQD